MDPRAFKRFKKNRGALVGAALVALLVAFALFGPIFSTQDPFASDLVHGRTEDGTPAPPTFAHWFGTDSLFRDELSRLAHGARLSLEIGLAASIISLFIGAAAGIVAGYSYGKSWALGPLRLWLDGAIMRFVD